MGSVTPLESASVRAQVTGPVSEVLFTEGEPVRQGQPLFQIDARPYQAALGQARARLERTRAELLHAEAQAKRYADLANQGFISAQEEEAIRTQAASLQASVKEGEEAVASAQLSLGYATVRAPISGRAGSAQVKRGNSVKSNEAVLVEIHQVDPIQIVFGIPGDSLPALQRALTAGNPEVRARIAGSPDPLVGELAFVDNAISPTTGTLELKARFGNSSGLLWPGQTAEVALLLGVERQAVAVPDAAVMRGQLGAYAFVVSGGKAQRRALETGLSEGGWTVVTRGIEAGETVVTDGQLRLTDGAPVQDAGKPEEPAAK